MSQTGRSRRGNEMYAVILAGGTGSRLHPYTAVIPKPLVPIAEDMPIMGIMLHQLATHGFRSVTVAIGHGGRLVRSYFGAGDPWGLSIDYVEEEEPLGTIGPLLPILERLPDDFLVLNSDVVTDLDYSGLLGHHRDSSAALTVAICNRGSRVDYGVVEVDRGRIARFREKPLVSHQVNMGVYAFSRRALSHYPVGGPLAFDEVVHDLLASGDSPVAYPWTGYWRDIGHSDEYQRACEEFGTAWPELLAQHWKSRHRVSS
jgi:NDP-mannose synthase